MSAHAPQRFVRKSRSAALALLAAVSLAASACDDDPTRETRPTTFASSSVSFSAQSTTVFAQPVGNAFCPRVAPFSVPMVVVVRPGGALDLVVTNIQLQFTDTLGRQQPQVTLPGPVPVTQFGDALDRALRFPVTLGIGCGVGRTGTVVVIVQTRDRPGRHDSGRLSFEVR
jgi:hypothetical protein